MKNSSKKIIALLGPTNNLRKIDLNGPDKELIGNYVLVDKKRSTVIGRVDSKFKRCGTYPIFNPGLSFTKPSAG